MEAGAGWIGAAALSWDGFLRKKFCIVSERFFNKCQRSAICLALGAPCLAHARVISSTIATDDFHAWMSLQPLGKSFGFSIRQKVHWHALFQINEDSAEGDPTPKREVIHSQYARGSMRGFLRGVDQPEQRIRAGDKAHACHQPPPGFPSQGKADEGKNVGEPGGSASVGSNHGRKPFRENLASALLVGAEEATHMQFQSHCAAHPREISQQTHIARMDFF
jgi:hypothetical protein